MKLVLHNSAMVPLEKLPRFMKNARKFLPRNPDLTANLHIPATTVAGRRMISRNLTPSCTALIRPILILGFKR